ncbi:type II toxin-antitoxin system RelE/ParE family toxin [Sphingomonas sp.]|uniref:type II toxin-antitoxin system RelE/ParE family toxin n=1 Tax=Sphingomonas sp. TaxID=28214 RepID=UPI0035BBD54C
MNRIEQTRAFSGWFDGLRDETAKKQIAKLIAYAQADHFPDVRSVGRRVSEMRIHTGPGYRVYFTRRGETLIVLLGGGDKGTQARDIAAAQALAAVIHAAEG